MGIRSQNNPLAAYLDVFSNTGTDAAACGSSPNIGAPTGLTATGGIISDYSDPTSGNIYRAHVFTGTSPFNVTEIGDFGTTAEFLVVGGGGAGGGCQGREGTLYFP